MYSQRDRLDGGHAHALPIDRVQAADAVPHDKQAVREASHALVAASEAGGKPNPTISSSGSASTIAS